MRVRVATRIGGLGDSERLSLGCGGRGAGPQAVQSSVEIWRKPFKFPEIIRVRISSESFKFRRVWPPPPAVPHAAARRRGSGPSAAGLPHVGVCVGVPALLPRRTVRRHGL